MKERPILFSAPMVSALLEGRKTQTRRVVKPQPPVWVDRFGYTGMEPSKQHISGRGVHPEEGPADKWFRCPYGVPGDRLWVREKWAPLSHAVGVARTDPGVCALAARAFFAADYGQSIGEWPVSIWKPSIHMPRGVSRITLEVVSVRVELVNDIRARDCLAEGIDVPPMREDDPRLALACTWAGGFDAGNCQLARVLYRDLWESINGEGSWEANPWVWVVEFRRVEVQ